MTRDEIDVMWQKALHDSVRDGEQFTRYHFAEMVAAAEREACEKVLRDKAMSIEKEAQIADEEGDTEGVMALRSSAWLISVCEAEIRARGQQ